MDKIPKDINIKVHNNSENFLNYPKDSLTSGKI